MNQENKINELEKKIKYLENKILELENIITNNSIKNFNDFEINLDNENIDRCLPFFPEPPNLYRQYAFNN